MSLKSKFRFILLSILVVMLLSIGTVSATLTVKNVVSSSGINYRAANDSIGINVTSSSNVSFMGNLCAKQGATTYICTINDVATTATSTYQITNTNGETAVASIYVDNNIGSISYTITSTKDGVSLDYNVQDLGFNNNNMCSGISSVSVYDGTTLLNTVDVNGLPGTCTYTGYVNLSIKGSGEKSISVEVTDNVGNKKKSTPQNITIDVDAPQVVNGLIVKYAGKDEELSVIGGKASILVDLYFKIREDNLVSITLDLSQANTNPVIQYAYKNIDLSLGNCFVNESAKDKVKVHECYIKNVPLQLAGSSLDMTVTANDTFGNEVSTKISKTFTVDNIEPKVSIKTNNCDTTGRCFVRNGLNNITLTMSKDNFNKNKFVFLNIPGSTFGINKVQNCSGSECLASVLLTCDSGSAIDVSIASFAGIESQDDAGNIIAPYATTLYCDNNEPTVKDINITGENAGSVIKEIVSGSTIKIKATIAETESTELTATAFLDKAKNATEKGTCVKVSNYNFECSWTVSNINVGYYEANIEINVSDTIGNKASGTKKLMVLGFKSDNETPDLIEIRPGKLYPEELNRIVVDMATSNAIPYYVYATYDLVAKDNYDKVSVLHQQVDIGKCNYIGSLGTTSASLVFSEAAIINPYSGLDKTGKLELKFNDGLDPNSLDDEFIISCNISLIVKEGNYIYSKTQEVLLDMNFKAVNSKLCRMGTDCTPGEVFGDKIKDMEDSFWVKAKIMGQIDSLIPKLQSMCKLRDYINTASFLNNAIGAVAGGLDLGFGGAGGGLAGKITLGSVNLGYSLHYLDQCLFGTRVRNSDYIAGGNNYLPGRTNTAGGNDFYGSYTTDASGQERADLFTSFGRNKMIDASSCNGFVGELCDKLTCSLTEGINNATPDFSDVSSWKESGFYQFMNRTPKPDVSNSIYQAFKAQCWPAVYYNINKWRQTDCNYLYCLKVASYTGTDISTCDKTKYTQQCMIVVGEAYAMIPAEITKWVDNAGDFVKAGLPMVATSWSKKLLCEKYVSFETGTGIAAKTDSNKQAVCGNSETGTTKCNLAQIMLCQIPLQVARFEDTQTRARQSERFVYPSVPDMCTIANCFGKENCQYEQDMFKTINQINLPTGGFNKLDRDRAKNVAVMNTQINSLRSAKEAMYQSYYKTNEQKFVEWNNLNNRIIDLQREINTASAGVDLTTQKTELADATKKFGDLKTELSNARSQEMKEIDTNIEDLKNCMLQGSNCDPIKLAEQRKIPVYTSSKTDPTAYNQMSLSEQLRIDQNELSMYTKLKTMYDSAAANDKLVDGKLTFKETDDLMQLKRSLGIKDDAITGEQLKKSIAEQQLLVKTKAKVDNAEKAAGQFGNVLFMGLQFANANHMLEFMNGNNWINSWFGHKGKDVTDALDTNKWKESLCNPNSAVSVNWRAGDATEGNVISCEGGVCIPVLTYATERANLEYPNGTKYYIYSVVYYISPGDIRGNNEVGSYNIYFNGYGVKSMYGYKEDVKLKSYQVMSVQRVFKSPNKYTEMCIKFDDEFPSYNQAFGQAKEEYCRDIKESGTWTTGSPWIPPEEDEAVAEDGSIPEFDENGRRITATTSVDAKQPGVLE